jgi:FixJ family two-component response regulator
MQPAPPHPPLIAVVDDDPSMRKALERMLAHEGYAVATFASAEAYTAGRAAECGVDCVVLDVRMPGVTGLDLQRRLNESSHPAPIVMITGHGSAAIRDQALANGAVEVLDKPFSDETLLVAIRRALAR